MQNNFYREGLVEAQQKRDLLTKNNKQNAFYEKDIDTLFYCSKQLSDDEIKLNNYMESLRKVCRTEELEASKPYPAGRPFYEIKDTIASKDPNASKDIIAYNTLYSIFKIMPKGALLHVHSAAALSFDKFWSLLKDWDRTHQLNEDGQDLPQRLYVAWEQPDDDNIKKGTLIYQWSPLKRKNAASYRPLTDILADANDAEKLKQMLHFTKEEMRNYAYDWDGLNAMFSRTASLLEDKDFYIQYHNEFFLECIADNIQYIEMRSGFQGFCTSKQGRQRSSFRSVLAHPSYNWRQHFYFQEINAPDGLQSHEFLTCLQDTLKTVNNLHPDSPLHLRVILNARRNLDPQKTLENQAIINKLNSAIVFRHSKTLKELNDFVVGFDFVSEEDRGRTTHEYYSLFYHNAVSDSAPAWTEIFTDHDISRDKPRIQLIDFYLHDGESTWCANENIIDACIVSKYRVGHGFNLINHPGVLYDIPFIRTGSAHDTLTINSQAHCPILEICPISNQLLGYHRDLRTHPAGTLMRQGVQCVICSDDPQMFNNGGLSYDFWMAYMGFGLDLLSIKRLVYNAFYEAYRATKEDVFLTFNEQWAAFVQTAVAGIP